MAKKKKGVKKKNTPTPNEIYRLLLQQQRADEKKAKKRKPKQKFPTQEQENFILQQEIYKDFLREAELEPLYYKQQEISPEFDDLIRNAARASSKDPQEILDSPKYTKTIDNLLEKNKATLYRTSKSLLKFVKKTGKTKITITDGKHKKVVSPETAAHSVIKFEQKVKKDKDVVYVGIKTVQYLNGEVQIFLPEFSKEYDDIEADEYFEEFLDSDDVEYLIYN